MIFPSKDPIPQPGYQTIFALQCAISVSASLDARTKCSVISFVFVSQLVNEQEDVLGRNIQVRFVPQYLLFNALVRMRLSIGS